MPGTTAYEYKNSKGQTYFLHTMDITLRGTGKKQTIYYFAKEINGDRALPEIPAGYIVKESPSSGLPVLMKA